MCGGLFIGSRKSESLDSAFTLESAALCFITFSGIISIYINGSGSTFTLVIVGAAAGFTVNLDGFAATAIFFALFIVPWPFPENCRRQVSSALWALSPIISISPLEQSISSL